MKNILFAMIAMLLLSVSMVTAIAVDPCDPLNPAYVTGTVYDQNGDEVEGASVVVDCATQTGYATTNSNGNYLICFDADVCTYGTGLYAQATYGQASGINDKEEMCGDEKCFVPIGIADITIPEFGVIAGGIALIGALGVFMYRRK